MIFFSIGLPGRFATWCDALATGLVARALGAAEAVGANSLDELAMGLIRTQAAHLVVCSRHPVRRLQKEIVQRSRPALVALGDPRAALRQLLDFGALDFANAVKAVANSCATMRGLAAAPNVLLVPDNSGSDPIAVARMIAGHFGLGTSAEEIAAAVAGLAAAGIAPDVAEDDSWQAGLSEREQAVANGALRPYLLDLAAHADMGPLVWERELFFLYEDPPAPMPVAATRPVELTGRARVVIYGPGIHLPPGNWSAELVLAFSAETSGMAFTIDIYAGARLMHTQVESRGAQVVDVPIQFTVPETLDHPVEVRVLSEYNASAGQLALGQVTLASQKEAARHLRDYLGQMLQT